MKREQNKVLESSESQQKRDSNQVEKNVTCVIICELFEKLACAQICINQELKI